MWLWEETSHRSTHAPTSSLRSLFVCKHKQVQPLNTNALVRGGPKPPAGTLQAERKGAGFKIQPHLPKRAALFMDTVQQAQGGETRSRGRGAGRWLDAHCLRSSSTQCPGNSDPVLTVEEANISRAKATAPGGEKISWQVKHHFQQCLGLTSFSSAGPTWWCWQADRVA